MSPPSDGNVQLICRTLDTLIGLLLQQWRQDNMTSLAEWLITGGIVFVTHVTAGESGGLQFDPPVQEISSAWEQFCDLLSVAAYKSLQSSSAVFDAIRQHQELQGQPGSGAAAIDPDAASAQCIKVKTPPEFLDQVRSNISDSFRDDEATLEAALEQFVVFSSLLKDSVIKKRRPGPSPLVN